MFFMGIYTLVLILMYMGVVCPLLVPYMLYNSFYIVIRRYLCCCC